MYEAHRVGTGGEHAACPGLLPAARAILIDRGHLDPIHIYIHRATITHLGVGQLKLRPTKAHQSTILSVDGKAQRIPIRP